MSLKMRLCYSVAGVLAAKVPLTLAIRGCASWGGTASGLLSACSVERAWGSACRSTCDEILNRIKCERGTRP